MITITQKLHFSTGLAGRRKLTAKAPQPKPESPGRIPRISKLMALAIRFRQLLDEGVVYDYTELADLVHVCQPRITQIMNLAYLAPDIQEELLFLPLVTKGRDPIHEPLFRPFSVELNWHKQRQMWEELKRKRLQ